MRARLAILAICLTLAATAWAQSGGPVQGPVSKVTSNAITVMVGKVPATVGVVAATKFMKNGAPARLSDLAVGDRVSIRLTQGNGKAVADMVVILQP